MKARLAERADGNERFSGRVPSVWQTVRPVAGRTMDEYGPSRLLKNEDL